MKLMMANRTTTKQAFCLLLSVMALCSLVAIITPPTSFLFVMGGDAPGEPAPANTNTTQQSSQIDNTFSGGASTVVAGGGLATTVPGDVAASRKSASATMSRMSTTKLTRTVSSLKTVLTVVIISCAAILLIAMLALILFHFLPKSKRVKRRFRWFFTEKKDAYAQKLADSIVSTFKNTGGGGGDTTKLMDPQSIVAVIEAEWDDQVQKLEQEYTADVLKCLDDNATEQKKKLKEDLRKNGTFPTAKDVLGKIDAAIQGYDPTQGFFTTDKTQEVKTAVTNDFEKWMTAYREFKG